MYRIQSKTTGLFSNGGTYVVWSKTGKIWKQLNHLSAHITGLGRQAIDAYERNKAVVVEYELVETGSTPIQVHLQNAQERIDARNAESERIRAQWYATQVK